MTAEIISIINRRQKFHKQGRHDEWKLAANEFRSVTRAAKRRHYQKFVNGNFKAWDEINKARNPKQEEVADQELANKQNEAFSNVWNGQKQPDISNFINTNSSTPRPEIFCESIVEQAIKKQKSGSPGPDGLSPTLLKSARLELSSIIALLFNLFIRFSFVPSQRKSANIAPIPKVDHPKAPGDYRPIALASCLCKVYERVVSTFILNHTTHIWQNNNQYGFLPGRSTADAIIKVIEDWSEAKDKQQSTHAVFFDFAKAFDLVDHKILLEKLTKQLPEWVPSWIAAYLTDRQQRVKIGTTTTEWKSVEAGVIQGSVLEHVLFLLFKSLRVQRACPGLY